MEKIQSATVSGVALLLALCTAPAEGQHWQQVVAFTDAERSGDTLWYDSATALELSDGMFRVRLRYKPAKTPGYVKGEAIRVYLLQFEMCCPGRRTRMVAAISYDGNGKALRAYDDLFDEVPWRTEVPGSGGEWALNRVCLDLFWTKR